MSQSIQRIKFPELFFGFVAPAGADISITLQAFKAYFTARGYDVVEIKVTNGFPWFAQYVTPTIPLQTTPMYERYRSYIAYGNQLRSTFDDEVLAGYAINRVMSRRSKLPKKNPGDAFSKTVYLMHQFKRPEEIDLFRSVYGELFFQVSVYSRRGARVTFWQTNFQKAGTKPTAMYTDPKPSTFVSKTKMRWT